MHRPSIDWDNFFNNLWEGATEVHSEQGDLIPPGRIEAKKFRIIIFLLTDF